ncbi:MAG: HAD family hydrolase [Candidatus Eremiobacteraeota bacterium]|nr:HAD family hydrolase [Candidatus Eremiobacteraeota bacterium]
MNAPALQGTVKLVALDVDGTLIDRDLVIRPRVRDAIARMQERGVAGCLVTGRMFSATLPFARELNITAPLICYQGAAVFDPTSGKVLRETPLANAVVLDLIENVGRDGLHLQLYANDEYYVEHDNEYAELYAALSRHRPVVVPSLRERFAGSDSTKAVIVAHEDAAAAYIPRVREICGDRAYITRSYPQFIEVLNPAVNKGEALRFVAATLGVEMESVLAIGDSWNDAPLLEASGFGVAMGSAPPELLAVAGATVGDVAHDGVADALERFVLR